LKRATLKPFLWSQLLIKYQKIAQQKTKETGIKYSVDHIIPLKGRSASGLHVPWNIQIIPIKENMQKGNSMRGDTSR